MKNKDNWRSNNKQIDVLNNLKPKELKAIEDNECDDIEKSLKYKEIFDELSSKRMGEIYNMSKEIDFNNLIYYFRNPNLAPINFINFKGPIHIYNIKSGETSTRKIEGDKKTWNQN